MAEDREVSPTPSTAMNVVTQLQQFRQAIYKNLCKAQDATFELMDALLLTRTAQSLADLSLSCVFRRQWPSVYEALQDTRPDREQLMKLYIQQIPRSERIILAGDQTSWSRPFAKTLKERTYEHSPSQLGGRGRDCRIRLQYIGMDTRSTLEVGPCHCCTRELPVGTVRFLKQFHNYPK